MIHCFSFTLPRGSRKSFGPSNLFSHIAISDDMFLMFQMKSLKTYLNHIYTVYLYSVNFHCEFPLASKQCCAVTTIPCSVMEM